MMKKSFALGLALVPFFLLAQSYSTGAIYQQLEKLNTVGSVLYVAAHPDDENTQMISYFSNGLHLRTGYLAATRGDGGQNLIGTEIGELLGVIRTQELLEARKVDGGEQFFSRAVDFGYSKDPEETFSKWGKEQILQDFVWVIRKFRPDVIITRFSQEPGITHGHHTASAILAMEAFNLAGDPAVFPEQLAYVEPWAPSKIFWNIGLWYYQSMGKTIDETGLLKVDVGGYNPFLGESYTEISARSRTMHKSQGFGDAPSRGAEYEYLKQWAGEETNDIFGGIDQSWGRLKGGEATAKQLQLALKNFDPLNPIKILPNLIAARQSLNALEDDYWKSIKKTEIDRAIQLITGTFISLSSDQQYFTSGDSINVSLEIINRSEAEVKLASLTFTTGQERFIYNLPLENNQATTFSYRLVIPKEASLSSPYWLVANRQVEGRYTVNDPLMIGWPENKPWLESQISLKVEDQFINYSVPVYFKTTDRVKGEVMQPLTLGPKVIVQVDTKPLIFSNVKAQPMKVMVQAGTVNQSGMVTLKVPQGWSFTPKEIPFSLTKINEQQALSFSVTPPAGASEGEVIAIATTSEGSYKHGQFSINYDHIPQQVHFPEAKIKVIRLELNRVGTRIGYLMGSGDEVPGCLEQVGYQVDLLESDDMTLENLSKYDAVMVGIRAFNTLEWLTYKNEVLFSYAEKGGTVIVQYNTYGTVTPKIAPIEMKISRDRVTVEDTPVQFILPNHPVLNRPNKISNLDFENWVQERGLYFPKEWGPSFEAMLGMADPGEPQLTGSVLVAKYGKGYYVYTGLSFFRELPAGVPGAYRLLANMIALGKNPK